MRLFFENQDFRKKRYDDFYLKLQKKRKKQKNKSCKKMTVFKPLLFKQIIKKKFQ